MRQVASSRRGFRFVSVTVRYCVVPKQSVTNRMIQVPNLRYLPLVGFRTRTRLAVTEQLAGFIQWIGACLIGPAILEPSECSGLSRSCSGTSGSSVSRLVLGVLGFDLQSLL